MSQAIANSIKSDIKRWADIDCTACYMEKGIEHKPSKLISGKEKGVYVFVLNEEVCFKVGKAGSGSAARWDSQHYNFDKSTPSTFTKSFLSDLQRFSTYFAGDAKSELHNFHQILCDKLGPNFVLKKKFLQDVDSETIREIKEALPLRRWIQDNVCRIEFKILNSEPYNYDLDLLEKYVAFKLRPLYEG